MISVVTSVTEAQERSERTAHEMHIRLRDLKSAEAELHTLRQEKQQLLEDVDAAKGRVREMSLEKMAAERKLSEQIARCTRIEVRVVVVMLILVAIVSGIYDFVRCQVM